MYTVKAKRCCTHVVFSHVLNVYQGFIVEKRFWFLSLCRCILFFTCLSISSSSIDGMSSYIYAANQAQLCCGRFGRVGLHATVPCAAHSHATPEDNP